MRKVNIIKSFIVFFCLAVGLANMIPENKILAQNPPLAQHAISLSERYANPYVNNVFRENILLTIAYMNGSIKKSTDIDWQKINKQNHISITLEPGEVFAFHEDVLPAYKNKKIITTNAHFGGFEGFLSDGYLYGDGVCHLAALMYWTAKDARLTALAPVNHNFANIPEISKEYGVSIFSPDPLQNLYIENNFDKPVVFLFDYNNDRLSFSILKSE
jgi:hypothetical protein